MPKVRRLLRRIKQHPLGYISEWVFNRFPAIAARNIRPDLIVIHSKAAETLNVYHVPNERILRSHSFDWDWHLMEKDADRPAEVPDGQYVVFIADTPWGGFDYNYIDYEGAVTKAEYQESICHFFDQLEEKTGMPVVVAAHPKHTGEDDVYGGRPFIKFKTQALIKHSSGVVNHYSTAINFAVIYRKPVCLIALKKLRADNYFMSYISAYAEELAVQIHDIDDKAAVEALFENGVFSIEEGRFNQFMEKYLVSDRNDHRLYWDKYISVVNRLFQNAIPESASF